MSTARRFLLELVREFVAIRWLMGVCWRDAGGHWYVFRDAPMWFVARMAAIEDDDEGLRGLLQQARAELALRMQRLARDIDAAVARVPS